MTGAVGRLVKVTLDETLTARRAPEVVHERAVAIYDLLEDNSFTLVGHDGGAYWLHLKVEEQQRLLFDVRDAAGALVRVVGISLSPFRSLIRDYFTICDSYFAAVKTASPSRIEAIDMGRKALHDDCAELLRERLARRIVIDRDTARRLFTLICVLHARG